MKSASWHSISLEKAFASLQSHPRGLSEKEAKEREKEYGRNEFPREKIAGRAVLFFAQFKNPLIAILFAAAALSFLLREFIDMAVILIAVGINTFIGFLQENKANKAIRKLRNFVQRRAIVFRDGRETEIPTEAIVPGDILSLRAGDRIPADARLIEAREVETDEAALTGESMSVEKMPQTLPEGTIFAERKNMVFMGTMMVSGKATALVTATGGKTGLGETATLLRETPEDKTPLQLRLFRLSEFIGLAVAAIAVFVVIAGWLRGFDFFDILIVSVAMAVSAIPEGLTIAVTVILAIGMQRILQKGSLVRTLLAAETLGSVTVICTDKTGTLTEGKMSVVEILTPKDLLQKKMPKHDPKTMLRESDHTFLLSIGLLCNDASVENPKEELKDWKVIGSPTEQALLAAGYGAGLNKERLETLEPRLDELPFNSEEKYMATLHSDEKRNIIYAKGAPEKILGKCGSFLVVKKETLTVAKREILSEQYRALTESGLRVLAFAYKETAARSLVKDDLESMVFVGFVGIKDPIRETVAETVRLTRRAGIRPVVITGDHLLTALAIAKEAGIFSGPKQVMEGGELDRLSDEALLKRVSRVNLYARATPKHKIRIVDALQARGETVAIVGDGVNDAPAIKSADIGVALGSGTDVTKEAADIVLLDNNFSTIVEAVKQGRIIYENIKKVIVYFMADSFTEVVLIVGSLALQMPLPVIAAQILWVNVIADSFPAFALSFEKGEAEVMRDKPRPKNTPILDAEMKTLIFIIGIVTDVALFGLFAYLLGGGGDIDHIRTVIFAALGVDSLLYVYSCKNFRATLWHYNPFSNGFLNVSVLVGMLAMAASIHLEPLQTLLRTVPLSVSDWTIVFSLGIIKVFLIEATKWFFLAKEYRKKLAWRK